MEKLSKKVSSRSGNVNAFSAAGTYDDVFGGPPKYSTLSPRIEDYSEIFGGFRGSSIPVLEVPEADVDDADVFFDVTRSFDYSEVFRSLGDGDGDDFGFSSYHDLFVRLQSNGRDFGSSDETWTPAETESLSEGSVTSPHSAQSKSLSNGVSEQSLDNPRQFNLSFHRANPSEEDITTEVHVAQLHAVPGYTFLVDECTPFQRTMFEETHLPGTDDMNFRRHATEGIKREKNLRKTVSQPQDHNFAMHELENDYQREREICYSDSHSNKAFVSISDITLSTHPSDLPPPSRPPPPFNVRNGYSGELPSNFRARNHEFGWTSDDNAPPVYDVEIDAGSSSIASAAAMKEAMEKAQSKLRSAKEIMERRKEGLDLPSRVKMGMKDVRVKEGKKSRSHDRLRNMNADKVSVAPDIDERKIDTFIGEERKEVKKPINITSNIMEGDKFIFVTEETSMKNDSKETWSTEEPCSVYEAGEWKQATEFFELVTRDKPAPAQGNQEKVCVQNDEVQDNFLESRAYSEAFKHGEENCMRENAAREAYVGDDRKKFNLGEETRGHIENKKKENVGQEVSRLIEREKKSRKLRKHKEISQKLSAVNEWKEHDILIEVLEDEHYLDAFQQRGKQYGKISEKGEQEKKTNKSIDIEEDVTRLVHHHVKEKSEKKTKASELVGIEEASCEKKESQNYLKDVTEKKNHGMSHQGEKQEACEPIEIKSKQKASLEIQESERQMQEARKKAEIERQHWAACEREETERKITEALERAETQKKQGAVCEAEESERQTKAAREHAESEKNQKEANEREKNERYMKEACEQAEIEKRLKFFPDEAEKHLKQSLEQTDIEKSRKAASDESKKRLNESCEHIEKREKNVGLEDEKRLREACEREEKEKCFEDVSVKKEQMLNGPLCSDGNEKVSAEALDKEEIEMLEKEVKENGLNTREAYESNGVDHRSERVYLHEGSYVKLKVANEIGGRKKEMENVVEQEEMREKSKQAFKRNESEKLTVLGEEQARLQKACVVKSTHETKSESSLAEEVYVDVGAERVKPSEEVRKVALRKEVSAQTASKGEETNKFSSYKEKIETETELDGGRKVADPFKMEKGVAANICLAPATAHSDSKNQEFHIIKENVNNSFCAETRIQTGDAAVGSSNKLKVSEMASHCEDVEGPATNSKSEVSHLGEREKVLEQPQMSSDQEMNHMIGKPPKMVNGDVEKERRFSSSQTSEGNGEGQKEAPAVKSNPNSETGNQNVNGEINSEERKQEERLKKESELEKERQRKMEEEREREREREKDRMAVERATYEIRERAYVDARERAERAAIEKATAEARQRALAEARERLERACAEAREKTFTNKQSMDARIKAERAAVERATTEARERAFEKTMSGRFFSDSSNRASSNARNSEIVEGESAQRCKARLERHQRTAERAAKALAEKNKRDLLAQREQAEKNRLAESLGADVKRWSSGKEGNLRALLSTLQYILGADSGWQPIPLTDVITSAAVKKAYRKATLCVHPDKLQQRGASIQQKYICEKVFDLLKDAWNKFNSEER